MLAYATLVVLLAGLEISWRLDDRRPGVISLHSKLGLFRYMHRSIVSSAGRFALFLWQSAHPGHFNASARSGLQQLAVHRIFRTRNGSCCAGCPCHSQLCSRFLSCSAVWYVHL